MSDCIILLSGGLDSLVALDYAINRLNYNVKMALTFDYGQKAFLKENESSKKISDYYKVEHKTIKLDWLKEITNTALVSDNKIPNNKFETKESAKSVWVPNRNALFLNIAAAYCDSYGFEYIIYGANKDEGKNVPDNTEVFRAQLSKTFESSTMVKPKILAPLINYSKDDIVRIAIEDSVPLELVNSCYNSGGVHCGECESCHYLKKALLANNCRELIKKLFKNEDVIY